MVTHICCYFFRIFGRYFDQRGPSFAINKLWMRFGILLSMIVGAIVLGLIFSGLFTPIAFFMRLSGRYELRLKYEKKPSHWTLRNEPIKSGSFKLQF